MKTISDNAGIDYSMGRANRDSVTGIHYGVISQHSVTGESLMDIEYIYPECEECDEECNCDFESIGFTYNQEGYEIIDCLDSDMMILKSPYYTFCQYCSPCVPGAGNLQSPIENGIKTYCLDRTWFDEYNPCLYEHIYRVSDDTEVLTGEL